MSHGMGASHGREALGQWGPSPRTGGFLQRAFPYPGSLIIRQKVNMATNKPYIMARFFECALCHAGSLMRLKLIGR